VRRSSLGEFQGQVDPFLLLLGQLVVVDGLELSSEIGVLGHAADYRGQLQASLISDVLLLNDVREKNHDALKVLVLVAENEQWLFL
jgi:hypothetical protein